MTMGVAAAASFPAPFVDASGADVAIVYGASASSLDITQTVAITTALNQAMPEMGSAGMVAGDGVTENEVRLGTTIVSGEIKSSHDEGELSSLLDTEISWYDGYNSDDYKIHEEVNITNMRTMTTLDDEDLEGVAMTNEMGLIYKLVIEEAFNITQVGETDADALYLEILGTEYEIEDMTNNSITVATSTKTSLAIGETVNVAGKVVTLTDVFESTIDVSVDGVVENVPLSGGSERINGIRVDVESIGYHSNSPETSKATIKVGEDIRDTFSTDEEFIGEDDTNPLWVWNIEGLESDNGWIGVKYNVNINDADDLEAGDSIKYIGEGYSFPNNYAAVTLDGLTEVDYTDLVISLDTIDLRPADEDNNTITTEDAEAIIIESSLDEAITVAGFEVSTLAIVYDTSDSKYKVYFKDTIEEYGAISHYRYASTTGAVSASNLTDAEVATVEIGDTNLNIRLGTAGNITTLNITNDNQIGSVNLLNVALGTNSSDDISLASFGKIVEDAESSDVIFNGVDVSTQDSNYMDYFGVKISDGTDVETEVDKDEVTLSIPDEQVYAQISVSTGATSSDGVSELGEIVVLDSEVSTVSSKNLIVVGGSCVNTVAAELLSNGAACGPSFTEKTGISTGEYIIKSVGDAYTTGKIALVVAGYDAEDTRAGVSYLLNQDVDTTAGTTLKGTSETSATVFSL